MVQGGAEGVTLSGARWGGQRQRPHAEERDPDSISKSSHPTVLHLI